MFGAFNLKHVIREWGLALGIVFLFINGTMFHELK
ncbi:unnamed protein product [Onchocerca flexuosa]|uniref:ABC transporter permease n=1 Tax=Onchocerca flexuosa TaxID=387005 RepID=A0A183I375_9BILA|nr:unnamed protein product [Onchocerca flexuosa]